MHRKVKSTKRYIAIQNIEKIGERVATPRLRL